MELHRRVEQYADAGFGACWLQDPRVASAVREALEEEEGTNHDLIAWCVMPNHVHVIVRPKHRVALSRLIRRWKAHSGRKANLLLARTGPFWMRGYFDRFIRSSEHLAHAVRYVESNPVKAGLVSRPEAWPFSSAAGRVQGEIAS